LNTRIFESSNRSVVATPVGQKIIVQAKVVLEEAQKIVELARGDLKPLSGPLRMGAIATLGPYYLPHIISPLRKKFPQLELHLREGLTDALISDLKAGDLDVVLASPTFSDDSLKCFRYLWSLFYWLRLWGTCCLRKIF
jgi:LysR family hydrogen peroxide-inducible transcriptional activator